MDHTDTEEKLYKLINLYMIYYRKAYPEKKIKNMFDNITEDDMLATNHILESFYEEILIYKTIDNKVYTEVNNTELLEKRDIVYGLYIDNCITCIAFSIVSLLIEVIKLNYDIKDNINKWNIINIK